MACLPDWPTFGKCDIGKLTGICIESWNIDANTKFKDVNCDYIFQSEKPNAFGVQERLPHDPDKIFQPGDFEKLFKQLMDTVKILLRNGGDRESFNAAFGKLMQAFPAITPDAIQAVERKGNDALVTLQVPKDMDKGAIEKLLEENYQLRLEAKTKAALLAKEEHHRKIFLSSTYVDLIAYRQAATEALERLGQQVGRMEIFGARPVEPSNACLSEIEDCDLFVGVYAHRYGYIPDGSMISITEAEFRHARKLNKPIFCFVVEANHPWPPEMIENEPGRAKLIALKATLSSSLVRDTFSTPENLAYKIATSVGRYLAQFSSLLLPPPQMQIVGPPGSCFGRLDSKDGQFALLLQVKFRNESMQPVLLQHFRIHYANSWYTPQLRTGSVNLYISTNILGSGLRREDDINESLRIPEMAEIKRHAFFILPDPPEPFPGPERLHLTAEATFMQRSPQQVTFTLTDRGEIEQEGGTGNQEDT